MVELDEESSLAFVVIQKGKNLTSESEMLVSPHPLHLVYEVTPSITFSQYGHQARFSFT